MEKMRRKDRMIKEQKEIEAILKKCEYGVLSVVSPEGKPYGVPLNYVYEDGKIYFHCAKEGYKLRAIESNPDVAFCVVGDHHAVPEKFSEKYESVMVEGKAHVLEGDDKVTGLLSLVKKYSPDFMEEGRAYIDKAAKHTKVIAINISGLSGKRC